MKINKKIILTIMLLLPVLVFSQFNYYYGKNKVVKKSFDWKYLKTPNFIIYNYASNSELIKNIALEAEKAYEKISKFLNVEIKKRVPIIFYNTHIDFEQTNLYPGFIPMGAIAFAEPIANRVVLQGDRSYHDLINTLVHELGHIFEYTVIYKSVKSSTTALSRPPLWVMEGFADYVTEDWDPFNLLVLRDSVLNDRLPNFDKRGEMVFQYANARSAYDFGHLVYEFVEHKFGKRGVRRMLFSFKKGAILRGKGRGLYASLNITQKEFNYQFRKYARDRFKDYKLKENPEDYSFIVGPEFPYFFSFSHQISPSGELAATATVNYKNRTLDIILISMKTGKVVKKLTPGFTTRYDNINIQYNPEDGISFSWNNTGDKIAFFARKEFDNYLVIIDALTGKILKQRRLEIQDPSSPDFHPSNGQIYFTAIDYSKANIYSYDLKTDTVKRLTSGANYIRSINITPKGDKIVYSARQGKFLKLFLAPIDDLGAARQLTFGNYNDITPVFSRDAKTIYYSSDELKSYNIYSIDLAKMVRYRYTDVQTSNFFPVEIPGEKDQLLISSFFKGMFLLFKKDTRQILAANKIPDPNNQVMAESGQKEIEDGPADSETDGVVSTQGVSKMVAGGLEGSDLFEEAGEYKPFKNIFITALPPITAGFATDGSILGYTYLTLSDLMGDHNFMIYVASIYGYESYNVQYLNKKSRLQFFLNLFYYKDAFRNFYTNYNYITLRTRLGGGIGFRYPFNRSYRAELSVSFFDQQENSDTEFYGVELPFAQFFNGPAMPVTFSLTAETTMFAGWGPIRGHTFSLAYQRYIPLGDKFLDSYSIVADLRKYVKLSNSALLAFRFNGFMSKGENPSLFWTGGNNTIRSAGFRSVTGNTGFVFNAELRLPLISQASTILGTFGPIRGVIFFDVGGAWFDQDEDYKFFAGDGLKLENGIASYGFGIEFFMWGYPLHFEWVYQTNLVEKDFARFNFWIGFDF